MLKMLEMLHTEEIYLEDFVLKCEKHFKKIIDVDHWWNSTYLMLDCAYNYEENITMFCNEYFLGEC